jgi:hypothetical protein
MRMCAVTDRLYTPQVVVNAACTLWAATKSAIEQAIAQEPQERRHVASAVTLTLTDGKLNVAVPDVAQGETGGEVWVSGW